MMKDREEYTKPYKENKNERSKKRRDNKDKT